MASVAVWSFLLSLLMLGPALGPGFVLSYDMVWVPELDLRPSALGVGSGLPREVPSDAVVAVLDEVVPGSFLQKLVLVATLVAAGTGAAALVPTAPLVARCAGASLYVWNPFVVERLVIGHWPILVGYAALPWLIRGAQRVRREGVVPGSLWLLVPLASLSAGAGIGSALAVLAFGISRSRRTNAVLLGLVLAANLPWLVAGALHAGEATTDPVGAEVFAARGEGFLPGPLAALGLGGIWNTEVVPVTREGVLAVMALVLVVGASLAGLRTWWTTETTRDRAGYIWCWTIGFGLAVVSWAAGGSLGWVAEHIPGGGLLRDGSRLLGLCAPLLVVLFVHGLVRLHRALSGAFGAVTVGMLVLAPVAFMPDAAWGVSGELRAVSYPESYAEARDVVGDASGAELLVLPFSSYRAPAWNHNHKVLSPVGRYLSPDHVTSDELFVSGTLVEGEDPRGAEVRQALGQSSPGARADELARLGIGVVVVEQDALGEAPDIEGTVLMEDSDLRVIELDRPRVREVPGRWWAAMGVAWVTFLAIPGGGLLMSWRGRRTSIPKSK